MSGMNPRNRPAARKGLLSLVAGLWLFTAMAPCVMAASCLTGMGGPCPMSAAPGSSHNGDCDSAQATACPITVAERQPVRLPVADLDISAPTVIAITLPPAPEAAGITRNHLHPEQFALRLSPPPLYQQFAVYRI